MTAADVSQLQEKFEEIYCKLLSKIPEPVVKTEHISNNELLQLNLLKINIPFFDCSIKVFQNFLALFDALLPIMPSYRICKIFST